jgi:hypothetical protein
VTSPAGHALAVTRIPRTRTRTETAPDAPGRPHATDWPEGKGWEGRGRSEGQSSLEGQSSPGGQGWPGGQNWLDGSGWLDGASGQTSVVGRVTLTIPESDLADDAGPAAALPDGILGRALRAAAGAANRAAAQAAADAAAGGCAHTTATSAYHPPPRLKEYITARDLTCRFPSCRQPAWRGDLDHTQPYDQGGLTCSCNLGGLCRHHHILKQHPDWQLTQFRPGIFQWTTPTGRGYLASPETHLV